MEFLYDKIESQSENIESLYKDRVIGRLGMSGVIDETDLTSVEK